MKLIIDIPDELFSIFKKHGIMAFDYFNEHDKDQIAIAIAHGTPYNEEEATAFKEEIVAESLDYQRAVEDTEYCERHEPTYNPDDGSM